MQEHDPYEIIPFILEQSWEKIEQKILQVSPFAKTLHIDLLDGKFAPNTTFSDPAPFKTYSQDFFLELHMMVEEPINYIESFAQAGFRRFLGHVEQMSDQAAFVVKAQQYGEVGLVLDGPTSLSRVTVPLIDLDCMLCYTSEKVGFSGPPFMESRLEKVAAIRAETGDIFPIEVDGGVTDETLIIAKNAGATRFISTSFLFNHGDVKMQYDLLVAALNG
jgi:ribulose-phosphate 3-epimerase